MAHKSRNHIILGAGVLGLGVISLLHTLRVYDFSTLLHNWWPLIFVVMGILQLANGTKNYIWSLGLMILGAALILNNFNVIQFNVWTIFWPVLLIMIGLSLVFKKSDPGIPATKAQSVSELVFFSGSERNITSDNFTNGDITALFGGVDLDLSSAKLHKNAYIDVFVAFGGADIKVPKNTRIHSDVFALFGGVDIPHTQPSSGPILRIKGLCLFGGIEIKYL